VTRLLIEAGKIPGFLQVLMSLVPFLIFLDKPCLCPNAHNSAGKEITVDTDEPAVAEPKSDAEESSEADA